MYDVVIIGAGIIGSMLAKDLSKYKLKVALVDKENDVANVVSMANSAIVHSGHDPKENTLKARLNVEGNRMYEETCKELHASYTKCGAFVVATNQEEKDTLETIIKKTKDRGIPYSILTGEEARKKEPCLSDEIVMAIDLPSTAIICPWEVAIASCEFALLNGLDLFLNEECKSIEKKDACFTVHTIHHSLDTRYIMNCAGLGAQKIYEMVSAKSNFHIIPKRGEYYVLDRNIKTLSERIIYPVPSSLGKGVLLVPTTHGNYLLGPNSLVCEDGNDNSTSIEGLEYVRNHVSKTIKNVPFQKVIRTFAGVRPCSDRDDFILEEAVDVPRFINIAGIDSPGLASAPAISKYVIEEILGKKEVLDKKDTIVPLETTPVVLKNMKEEERNAYIQANPMYGHIICRCEEVSEGEIVDSIHRILGARSVKAVKKRVRPGMGKCQGGFCEPYVVQLLARELGISPLEVMHDSIHSPILESEISNDK